MVILIYLTYLIRKKFFHGTESSGVIYKIICFLYFINEVQTLSLFHKKE